MGKKGLALALAMLARRDHSTGELARKLAAKGITAAEIEEVTERLKEAGYIDDRRLAGRWAEQLVESGKGYGPRLRQELERRGFPRELVQETVAVVSEGHDEGETLKAVLERRYPDLDRRLGDDREKRRIIGYLQRRGFSFAAILQALRESEGV